MGLRNNQNAAVCSTRWLLLSVPGAVMHILLSVHSELIISLLSVERKYLLYSISSLMAVVLVWFNMERVLIDRNPAV